MEKNAVVSVSLLTAGKKRELEKCIMSLQPLMQAVPSELIIVDTGCDKESRTLIERYATKIVDFDWCDDFARARNAGLKKATGEWFLYLDDDEWFEDISEIIAFFQTGEYRNYQYAMYIVRNYEDFEGKHYNDSPVGRMIQLKPDTHFIYAIHECFADVGACTKYFSTFVHHYGYAYRSDEERIQHAKRNLPLLWAEHEREPENLRHTLQLMQEYRSLQEYDKIVELGCAAIRKYDSDDNEQIYYFNSLLVLTLLALTGQDQMQELVVLGEQLRNHPYIGKLAAAYVCALLTYGYRETGQYREAMQAAENYLDLLEEYRRDASCFTPFETGILTPCFQEKTFHAVLENGIMAAIAVNDFKMILDWCELLCCEEGVFCVSEKLMEEIITRLPDEELKSLKRKCGQLGGTEWQDAVNRVLCRADGLSATRIYGLLHQYVEEQKMWLACSGQEVTRHPSDKTILENTVRMIEQLENAHRAKNAKQLVETLKQLLQLQPGWAEVIKICMEEAIQILDASKSQEQTEFLRLAEQVKEQVRVLISHGKGREASAILKQLQSMVPTDEEVERLLGQVDAADLETTSEET